uniref:Uncharacterized protein n=1 Tax=Thelephora ganbajun TaxID=370292 RepID=A0A343B743_THEGA|nr:hypothetical protein [Thelephora ganbajun]
MFKNNENNTNLNIFLDNSQKESIINRENGIYKIYDNLFLNAGDIGVSKEYLTNNLNIIDELTKMSSNPNYFPQIKHTQDQFIFNLVKILEDLYDNDNNEWTFFKLYFLVKPDFDKFIRFDIVKMNEHFAKYPVEFIDENIVKFYKNTGLLTAVGVFVFASLYDIENLKKISLNIKKQINKNIEIINKNVHKDLNNTIINYTNKFDINSEIMLIIHADFDQIKPMSI